MTKRMIKMKKLFDKSLLSFLLIGAGNTLLSTAMMYLLYTLAGFGYWGSSAVAFAATSVISFLLKQEAVLPIRGKCVVAALRFSLVIAACYLIAYSLAQPATVWLLRSVAGASLPAETIEKGGASDRAGALHRPQLHRPAVLRIRKQA